MDTSDWVTAILAVAALIVSVGTFLVTYTERRYSNFLRKHLRPSRNFQNEAVGARPIRSLDDFKGDEDLLARAIADGVFKHGSPGTIDIWPRSK
jgi:hypothetical protein